VRVHVISDMEGVAGIVKWQQTTGGDPMYEEGRRLYTEEVNAAVRGAKSAGATEIVVMDCHGAGKGWTFNSLVPDLLDPACEFVVQEEWTGYTELLEQGCDAALFVAMHARAGASDGVLNHTVSGKNWHELRFNGVAVGETGINAALCGTGAVRSSWSRETGRHVRRRASCSGPGSRPSRSSKASAASAPGRSLRSVRAS
jgi:D-amino peptidase